MLRNLENAGIKVTTRRVFGGISTEQTVYVQGDRKRMEFRNHRGGRKGPPLAAITRCDLGQRFELNLDTAEYVSTLYPPTPLTQAEVEARGIRRPPTLRSGEPTLRIETTTRDTGERKEFFGYAARRVITTRREIPLEGSHRELQEAVTDGWYIDLDLRVSSDRRLAKGKPAHTYAVAGNEPPEKPEFIDIGETETGFPVQSVMASKSTHTLPDGTKKQTNSRIETLVTHLALGPLDPSLFEIPLGFRHVQQIERNPKPSTSSRRSFRASLRAKTASFLRLFRS